MPSNIGIGTMLRNLAATFAVAVAAMSAVFVVLVLSVGTRAAETQSEPSTTATLQGVVRDSDNRPVAGASVYLQPSDAQTLAGPPTVLTDRAGAYRFSAVRQGVYTLRAEATGYHDASLLHRKSPKQLISCSNLRKHPGSKILRLDCLNSSTTPTLPWRA